MQTNIRQGGGTLNKTPLKKVKKMNIIIFVLVGVLLFSITTFTSYALFTSEVEGQNSISLTVSTAGKISIRIFAQETGEEVSTLKNHTNIIEFDVKPGYEMDSFSCTTGEESIYDRKTNILTIKNAKENGTCEINYDKIPNLSSNWKDYTEDENNFLALYTITTKELPSSREYNGTTYTLSTTVDVSEQRNNNVRLGTYVNGTNKIAIIGQEGGVIAPINSQRLFGTSDNENSMKFQTIDLTNLDTSKVTDMSYMFYNCDDVTNLNINNLDTRNVKKMNRMFQNCKSMTTLNISKFNTSQVNDMSSMFLNCTSLEKLDLTSFTTSNVTSMEYMFYRCSSLKELKVTSFDTKGVTLMRAMFADCASLTSIDLRNFNTILASNTTDNGRNGMANMFVNCSGLQNTTGKTLKVTTGIFIIKADIDFGLSDSKIEWF